LVFWKEEIKQHPLSYLKNIQISKQPQMGNVCNYTDDMRTADTKVLNKTGNLRFKTNMALSDSPSKKRTGKKNPMKHLQSIHSHDLGSLNSSHDFNTQKNYEENVLLADKLIESNIH
jgi:hypothetical protein